MLPTFIIIGAAKAGTTALLLVLRRAPCRVHEPGEGDLHFAYGRDASGNLLYGDPDVHRFPITTLAEYEALFSDAGGRSRSAKHRPSTSNVHSPPTGSEA